MPLEDSSNSPDAIRVVAAVIEKDGRYLITQRRPTAALPLLWEFPGGKVEPGETDEEALAREVRHRLGATIEVHGKISHVRHAYEKYTVELFLYSGTLRGGELAPRNVNDFRWVLSSEFETVKFTPADERSMSQLLGLN